jgi:hypothetical protein
MLVVAALLVGLNVGFLTAQRLYGSPEIDARKRLETRVAELMNGRELPDLSPEEIKDLGPKISPLTRELVRSRMPRFVTAVSFGLLLLAIAAVVYAGHPGRLRRRHKSRPLRQTDAPTVVRYLEQCTANLGLPPLNLEYRPGLGNEAQTFGLSGRETLLFHGDPILLEGAWSDTLKAIALHEVGHVANGDAQDREKSKALWIALLSVLLVALGLWGLLTLIDLSEIYWMRGAAAAMGSLPPYGWSLYQSGWRIAAMLLLILMIWLGLVRIREHYADRRVESWGLGSALDRLLHLPDSRAAWWKRAEGLEPVLGSHPSNRVRREVLTDTTRLFQISPHLAFVTGVLLSILTVNLIFPLIETISDLSLAASTRFWSEWASYFLSIPPPWGKRLLLLAVAVQNLGTTFLLFFLGLGMVSYLLAGTLGTQVQRQTIADLATGNPRAWRYGRLLAPAALLACGVETGFFVAPFNDGLEFSRGAGTLLLWLSGLTFFTWLWLAYLRALTRFTIGMHAGATLPRRLRRTVTGSAMVLLTILYWPAGFARLSPRIPLWTRDLDSKEAFIYSIVITGFILVIFVVTVYLAWAGVSLAVVFTRLRRRRSRCSACGDPLSLGFALGRCCASCGELLAAWAYAGAPSGPACATKGRQLS